MKNQKLHVVCTLKSQVHGSLCPKCSAHEMQTLGASSRDDSLIRKLRASKHARPGIKNQQFLVDSITKIGNF